MAENLIFDLVNHHAETENFTAFDIGANVGKFTVLFARKYKHVVAFEAHPSTCLVLKSKVQHMPNVTCEDLAITDKNEDIKLYLQGTSGKNKGGNTTAERVAGKSKWGHNKGNFISVKSNTIDKYVADNNIDNLRLIKVDVEGAEDYLFNGAIETIKNTPKLDILLETHQTVRVDRLTQFFLDLGCKLYLGNRPGEKPIILPVGPEYDRNRRNEIKHDQHYLITNYEITPP